MSVETRTRVAAAARAIAPHVRRTPTEHSPALSALAGCELYLKLENLQKTGAFKIRGALNKLLSMDARVRARGVVTASAGNHGQGVALAAKLLGIQACVVLPAGVSLAKLAAVQRHGAEVIVTGDDYDASHQAALELARDRGLEYVHAFDDDDVIVGQGTLALEMLDDAPGLDAIVVPVGGGGLLSGIALAVRERASARPRLIGVQAAGSPAFARSFASGSLVEVGNGTIADGIAVRRPAQRTLEIARESVDEVRTVNDEAIARAIVLLLERHKLLAEGAGAAALAAVLEHPGAFGGRVGVVISGGNIDPNLLGKVLQQGLASAGRYLAFRTWLDDKPGRLHALTGVLTEQRINILHVGIQRLGPYTALGKVGLDVIVETRDRAHASAVLELVRANGFPAEELLSNDPR
ncbi:MAG: threonine ammonia-lyase [Chloroflexi bacterium 13_1_40CM_4_68_4]|nr:MAG: threonine ammonia-lyase [Chloroflexi bacterium 13_1_40CM_4_68_4]